MTDKLSIATYFIMSAPIGEVTEVVDDVKRLVGEKVLSDSAVKDIMKQYNVEMMTSKKSLTGKTVFQESQGGVLKSAVAQKIDMQMEKYIEQQYQNGKCMAEVVEAKDDVIVRLSASNINLSNYWTGGWRAQYTLSGKKLKAVVRINVHYFEDGNVQLHTTVEKEMDVETGSPDETAASVVSGIANIENAYHEALDSMYVKMHQVTFKGLRRFLPISRKTMDWSMEIDVYEEHLGITGLM